MCFLTNPKNLPAIFYTTWKSNPSSQMWFFVQLCSSWQDFNWLKGSRGLSAAAELLVHCGNMQDYTNQFNMKYKKKNQFGGRKVARQGTTLGHKKWASATARPAQKPPLPTLYSSFGSTSIHACRYFQYIYGQWQTAPVFTGVNAKYCCYCHDTHTHTHTHTQDRMIYLDN